MTAALPQPERSVVRHAGLAPTGIFTPEFDLLLATCAETSGEHRLGWILRILQSGPDWARFTQLAQHHGVVPQAFRCLSAVAHFPFGNSLEGLQGQCQANTRQTLWLTGELLRVLTRLEGCGVEALPYKGPVLAGMLYGDVALRQFSDLDLLVRPPDLPKITAALAELGYESGLKLAPREQRAYIKSGYEYPFDSSHGRNLLEVKWQILPRFYSVAFDVEGFFDRAALAPLAGRMVRTLAAEDLLLVLCVNAAKHGWGRLSWLCDIAQLVKTQPLDWIAIQRQARRLGIQRIIAVTFLLAQRLLGLAVPPAMLPLAEKDHGAEILAGHLIPMMVSGSEYNTESLPYFRLMMQARERWPDRASFLWKLCLTPGVGEWSAVRLPGPLFPLYRVVRICRIVKRLL